MNYLKHPDAKTVDTHIASKEPLLIAISFDGENVLMSHIDDSVEHHILLAHFEEPAQNIDRYFRIAVDGESADWTFICPPDYRGIADRKRRITAFYNDGITAISRVLADIGCFSDIKILKRYRRHLDVIGDDPS